MNGGHYTAFAKNPTTNLWYEFDDTKITEKDEAKLEKEITAGSAAYVLFYQLA